MDDIQPIDGHAHVWDRSCAFVSGARHRPDYEATIDAYLRVLDAHGVGKALLVQPSFLGTDNTYLLACMRAHADRLRGIVVIPAETTAAELYDLAAQGVIGARFNMLDRDPGTLAAPSSIALVEALAARDWGMEVQVDGTHWPTVLDIVLRCGARAMIDHFGKPADATCPGHAALLATDPGRHCVKFSAPYRQRPSDATPFARAFLEAWGPTRCLWGSDWPWTQHEGRHGYSDTHRWLADWARPEEREAMAAAAPTLCGF